MPPTPAGGCCFYDCRSEACIVEPFELPYGYDDGADALGLNCGCLVRSLFIAYPRAAVRPPSAHAPFGISDSCPCSALSS